MNHTVKILIVDDSITYRQILMRVIDNITDAECIGTAASGQIALRKINSLQPDLVLLDVVMPDMDGVETLQKIKQTHPHIEAIMISSFDMNNAKETLRSLEVGALDFVTKPKAASPEAGIAELAKYLQPLIHLVETKKYAKLGRSTLQPPLTQPTQAAAPIIPKPHFAPPTQKILGRNKIDLILIGISTGGPKALDYLIPRLNAALSCPMIIVQHMPPMFTQSLAEKLDSLTRFKVSEVQGGEKLSAGHIYIAQGGKHLIIRERLNEGFYLAVNETPPVNNCRPAVDVLFRSVATTFKGKVLAIIMTGMGRDGTAGVKMLKRNDCYCIAQDEASSVVWGMPASVVEAGLADDVLPLEHISQKITELVL